MGGKLTLELSKKVQDIGEEQARAHEHRNPEHDRSLGPCHGWEMRRQRPPSKTLCQEGSKHCRPQNAKPASPHRDENE